jgi:hypothetical protein
MDRAYSTQVAKRNACRILVVRQKEINPKEVILVGGRIILRWILELGKMDGIDLTQDSD